MSLHARAQLSESEKAARMRILTEFQALQQRMKARFQELLSQIESQKTLTGSVSASFLFERDRLGTLLVDLAAQIKLIMIGVQAAITEAQIKAVDLAGGDTERLIQTISGKDQIVRFNPQAVKELIGNSQTGEPLGDFLARITPPVSEAVKTALVDGVANGSSSQAVAAEINTVLGTGAAHALTIARTEQNQAYRQAAVSHYKENGDIVKGFIWLAACDLRTCVICWSRHGKIYPLDKKPISHVNCRCTFLPYIPEMELPDSGKFLFSQLTKQQQEAILGKQRTTLYDKGLQLDDFVAEKKTAYGSTPYIKNLIDLPDPSKLRKAPAAPPVTAPVPPAVKKAAKPAPAPVKAPEVKAEPVPVKAVKGDFAWKTPAEAEKAMAKKYPQITFDFTGMDQRLINENAQEFDRLAKLFPEVADRMGYIGTYKKNEEIPYVRLSSGSIHKRRPTGKEWSKGSAYAHASQDGLRLGLNPELYKDYDILSAKRKRGRATGWSASEKVIASMTHEFGHHIDHWLESIWNEYAVGDYVAPSGAGELQDIISKWKRKYKVDAKTSQYAMTNKAEAWAEGFSMIHNRPREEWSNYAVQLDNLLTVLKENMQKITSDHFTGDPVSGKAKLKVVYAKLGLKMSQ